MATTSRIFVWGMLGGAAAGVALGYLISPQRVAAFRDQFASWRASWQTKPEAATAAIRIEVRDTPKSGWSENDLARADELMREANTILKDLKARRIAEPTSAE